MLISREKLRILDQDILQADKAFLHAKIIRVTVQLAITMTQSSCTYHIDLD